jgi:hypothetical protein
MRQVVLSAQPNAAYQQSTLLLDVFMISSQLGCTTPRNGNTSPQSVSGARSLQLAEKAKHQV